MIRELMKHSRELLANRGRQLKTRSTIEYAELINEQKEEIEALRETLADCERQLDEFLVMANASDFVEVVDSMTRLGMENKRLRQFLIALREIAAKALEVEIEKQSGVVTITSEHEVDPKKCVCEDHAHNGIGRVCIICFCPTPYFQTDACKRREHNKCQSKACTCVHHTEEKA